MVKTDDPEKKKFNLVVQGPVKKVADISPKSVYMEGNPGETLSSEVRITPSEQYPFGITEVVRRNNTPLKVELLPPEKDTNIWRIKVESQSDTVKNLYEVLQIKTDSQYMKTIKIRVFATFRQPPKTQLPAPKS